MFLGIFFHGESLFGVWLVWDPGEEFVDWFFENYVNSLSNPSFTVFRTFLPFFEHAIFLGESSQSSFGLPNIILQPSMHLYSRYEILEVDWEVEHQVVPQLLARSQPELVANNGEFSEHSLNSLYNCQYLLQ